MIRVGMRVSMPGTRITGVVCQIDGDDAYVMWGDNNRQRFRCDELTEVSA